MLLQGLGGWGSRFAASTAMTSKEPGAFIDDRLDDGLSSGRCDGEKIVGRLASSRRVSRRPLAGRYFTSMTRAGKRLVRSLIPRWRQKPATGLSLVETAQWGLLSA